MLTTYDNPFSPFSQFSEWYAFDVARGYHSAAFLARIVVTSDEQSEHDQAEDIEQAIDTIVSENVLGLWRKVRESDFNVDEE